MNNKLMIFGPWCGEFCYELSWWIPEIRKKSKEDYKNHDIFAVGFDGRKVLYEDFILKYFSYSKEIEDTLKYPSTGGEHVPGVGDIIPDHLVEYVQEIVAPYLDDYDEVQLYKPMTMPFDMRRTLNENPYGDYRHYDASPTIMESVKEEIKFNNDRETVAVMARIRNRLGKTCYLDWNPNSWKQFVELLVNDLRVNVVMIGIPQKKGSSAGASITFEDSDFVKGISFTGSDSVERQIALLKQTKCSIYGASGTAVFPFFIKDVHTFTQQSKDEGYRLKYQWERDLTNNLKNVKIFDKYKDGIELYNSPVDELYEEFKSFYEKII